MPLLKIRAPEITRKRVELVYDDKLVGGMNFSKNAIALAWTGEGVKFQIVYEKAGDASINIMGSTSGISFDYTAREQSLKNEFRSEEDKRVPLSKEEIAKKLFDRMLNTEPTSYEVKSVARRMWRTTEDSLANWRDQLQQTKDKKSAEGIEFFIAQMKMASDIFREAKVVISSKQKIRRTPMMGMGIARA